MKKLRFQNIPERLYITAQFSFPSFGIWKWRENDFRKPLTFIIELKNVKFKQKVNVFVDEPYPKKKFNIINSLYYEIEFTNLARKNRWILEAVSGEENSSKRLVYILYEIYKQVFNSVSNSLRLAGTTGLSVATPVDEDEFFYSYNKRNEYTENRGSFYRSRANVNWGSSDKWSVPGFGWWDEGEFLPSMKLIATRSPKFRNPQLITNDKWCTILEYIDYDEDIVALAAVKSKVENSVNKVDNFWFLVESISIIENRLRKFTFNFYIKKYKYAESKAKKTGDLFVILNNILPLIFRENFDKIKKDILVVDMYRGIRNDINKGGTKVDKKDIESCIKSSINIINFIIKKPETCKKNLALT